MRTVTRLCSPSAIACKLKNTCSGILIGILIGMLVILGMTMRRKMIPMKVMTIFMAVRHQEILSFPGCLLVQQDEEGPNVKGVNVGISTMAGYLMTNLSVSSISNLAVTINEVTAKRKDGRNITDTLTTVVLMFKDLEI